MTLAQPTAPSSSPREQARSVRRRILLEAAEQVFAERGFAGATMAEIARRADYSAANLYNVFENKEALFSEVLTASAEFVLEFTRKAGSGEMGFEAQLDQLIDSLFEFVAEHRGFFVILTQANPQFAWGSNRQNGQRDIGREIVEENERMFARVIEKGEIPVQDPRLYSCLFRGTINTYISSWVEAEGTPEELWEGGREIRSMLKRACGLSG